MRVQHTHTHTSSKPGEHRHGQGQRGQQSVHPVQDATVPRQKVRAVFDAGAPLDHGLEQVAHDTEHDQNGQAHRAHPKTLA